MRNFDGNLAQTRFVNRFLLLPLSHPGGSSGASRKRKGAPSLGGHMGGHRRIWSHYIMPLCQGRNPSPLAGGEGLGDQIRLNAQGGSQGLPPWWRPFGAPPGELVRGRDPWHRGNSAFSTLKGLLRVPHPLSPFECAPFERENYRQFFHRPSSRLYNTMEYYIVLYSTV